MLVPGFHPLCLPCVFPAGAGFMDLGISQEAPGCLDGLTLHITVLPSILTQ